ncbi:hypothetical protein OH76DRAFT_1406444 [Lentinus brumalis]|uniref:Uncharacterized protein n=1 Tax=Lentinus brumalis TaxID=2498619 RepID=A0A371D2V8_9APHY|nr:hypothetical protein OH76DRAFT_1406444 [Polyporus brumalis]
MREDVVVREGFTSPPYLTQQRISKKYLRARPPTAAFQSADEAPPLTSTFSLEAGLNSVRQVARSRPFRTCMFVQRAS